MRTVAFGLLAVLICSTVAVAQTLSPEVKELVKVDAPVVALTHVRVIDGTGTPAREDQTLIISQSKIQSVGTGNSLPAGAQVIDLNGHSVIPGLVGMHDHIFIRPATRFFTKRRSVFRASTWLAASPRFALPAALSLTPIC